MIDKISDKKKQKLYRLKEKYKIHENLIIARQARKTLRFIEKNTHNFPNEYKVLKDRIISTCYDILEEIYRANILQDIKDKKEVCVKIQMLNFYLEEALRKELLSNKKFLSYTNHLLELDKMVRSWFNYEKVR
ncbi:MAG: four helix bundle protein [Bacilli bacterium]|nr:four helix bundle protein [Bacilli bacterium]